MRINVVTFNILFKLKRDDIESLQQIFGGQTRLKRH